MKAKPNAPQLDATDNVFIRLCKHDKSMEMFRRWAKRFYLYDPGAIDERSVYSWIAMIGTEIVNKYFDITLPEFLYNLKQSSANLNIRFHPENFKDWNFEQMQGYVHAHAIIGMLSLTPADQLKPIGYRSHLYFRLPEEKRASLEEKKEVRKRLYEWRQSKNIDKDENVDMG